MDTFSRIVFASAMVSVGTGVLVGMLLTVALNTISMIRGWR